MYVALLELPVSGTCITTWYTPADPVVTEMYAGKSPNFNKFSNPSIILIPALSSNEFVTNSSELVGSTLTVYFT